MTELSTLNSTTKRGGTTTTQLENKIVCMKGGFVLTIEMNHKWFMHLFLLKTNVLSAFLLTVED